MKFSEIPQYTRAASYSVTISWSFLEKQLDYWTREMGVVLDPDFQRGHVWTEDKQRRYVEYVLRGGKSSLDIYFNCTGWNQHSPECIVLVDGKQRLTAVRKFLANGLEIFRGYRFSDFEDKLSHIHHSFIFHVNDLATRAEVLQWYLDINDGGVVHTEEELNKVRTLLEGEKNK